MAGLGTEVGVGPGASLGGDAAVEEAVGLGESIAPAGVGDADTLGIGEDDAPNPSCPPLIGTAIPTTIRPATTSSGRRFTERRRIAGILPEVREGAGPGKPVATPRS
jgi:hypothetical protein